MNAPYQRGLRVPHLDFLEQVRDGNGHEIFAGVVYLRAIVPVWKPIVRDLAAPVTLNEWPNLAGRINDLCRSYDPARVVQHGSLPVEPTQDPDEPEALWVTVISPLPESLLSDHSYDLGIEVVKEIADGVAWIVRQEQVNRGRGMREGTYYVQGEPGLAPHA